MKRMIAGLFLVVMVAGLAFAAISQRVSKDPQHEWWDLSDKLYPDGKVGRADLLFDGVLEGDTLLDTVWTRPFQNEGIGMGDQLMAWGLVIVQLATVNDTTEVDSLAYKTAPLPDVSIPLGRLAGDYEGDDVLIQPSTALTDTGMTHVIPMNWYGGQGFCLYVHTPDSVSVKLWLLRWSE